MVVGLGECVAYAKLLDVSAVRLDDEAMHIRVRALEPGGKCWAKVEADVLEIARLGVRPIALCCDAVVEILVGSCPRLTWNVPRKGILPRGLIKVPVQAKKLMDAASHSYLPVLQSSRRRCLARSLRAGPLLSPMTSAVPLRLLTGTMALSRPRARVEQRGRQPSTIQYPCQQTNPGKFRSPAYKRCTLVIPL